MPGFLSGIFLTLFVSVAVHACGCFRGDERDAARADLTETLAQLRACEARDSSIGGWIERGGK